MIILIALLGLAQVFTYTITYNTGNSTRTQSLAILQQRIEDLRAAKWTASGMDATLTGGAQADILVPSNNGGQYRISTVIDDDPYTDGIQTDSNTQIKEITITVKLDAPSPGWQFAVPAKVIIRRSRGN